MERVRAFRKSWQNKRPGWTRRVRWYEGGPGEKIRLQFEDTLGKSNGFFTTAEEAQAAYDAFIAAEEDA